MAQKQSLVTIVTPACEKLALSQGVEFCGVELTRESAGSYLRIYLDKDGGLTLDDCETYHRAVQPMLEKYEYDFLEVCSPGIDRPVKTERDIQKALGTLVEVRLYKPIDGRKTAQGILTRMDGEKVELDAREGTLSFPRTGVALVKLVPDLSALEENADE